MALVGTWEFVAVPPCLGQGTRSAVFLVRSDRGKRSRSEEKSQAQRSTSNNSSLHARLGRCQRRESSSASDLSRIYGRGGDDCARKTAGPDGPDGVPRSPSSPSAGWLARSSRGLVFRARRKHVKVDGGESLASRGDDGVGQHVFCPVFPEQFASPRGQARPCLGAPSSSEACTMAESPTTFTTRRRQLWLHIMATLMHLCANRRRAALLLRTWNPVQPLPSWPLICCVEVHLDLADRQGTRVLLTNTLT